MRRRHWLRILAPALALALAGPGACATGQSPAAPTVPPPTMVTSSGPQPCPFTLTVNESDSQKTVCFAHGGSLTLMLRGEPGRQWQPPTFDHDVLMATPGTAGPADTLVIVYTALRTGSSVITSSRNACPAPSPGSAACHALQTFQITVNAG